MSAVEGNGRSSRLRAAALGVVAAALAIAVVGCGGDNQTPHVATAQSDGPKQSTEATQAPQDAVVNRYVQQMQKFVDCLRKNGLPEIPDPDKYGRVLIETKGIPSQSALRRARTVCSRLVVPMPAEVRKLVDQEYAAQLTDAQKRTFAKYANCMQQNGAPDFPDPQPNGVPGDEEWNQTTSGAQHASATCASIVGDSPTEGPGVG